MVEPPVFENSADVRDGKNSEASSEPSNAALDDRRARRVYRYLQALLYFEHPPSH